MKWMNLIFSKIAALRAQREIFIRPIILILILIETIQALGTINLANFQIKLIPLIQLKIIGKISITPIITKA
jgi:hypothetical protein